MGKIYLMQIKSKSIKKEGKSALLIPMEMEDDLVFHDKKEIDDAMIRGNAIKLYPQYTKIEDMPIFTISKLTKKEYNTWLKTNVLNQKSIARGVS